MSTPFMELVQAGRRLCQMAYDAGLPSAQQQRLQLALAAAGAVAMLNARFAAWFKDAVVGFVDTLVAVTKTVDDLAARLQPTRPASALPAALAGLHGSRLLRALLALELPAATPENVHLEVALAAQRLILHHAIRGITRLYEKIISEGNTSAAFEIDVSMAAFLVQRVTLEAFVQKQIDLADAAAAGPAN